MAWANSRKAEIKVSKEEQQGVCWKEREKMARDKEYKLSEKQHLPKIKQLPANQFARLNAQK